MNLNEGEVICNKCDGKGFESHNVRGLCYKCKGAGKLDWVTNVMGRPKSLEWDISDVTSMVDMFKNCSTFSISLYEERGLTC